MATRTSSGHWDTLTYADSVDFGGNIHAYNPSFDWNLGDARIGPLGLDNLSESTMNRPMILARDGNRIQTYGGQISLFKDF